MNISARFAFWIISATIFSACAVPAVQSSPPDSQVLFVCLHGNVKSLMATEYFNELAEQRGLPYRAVSRGTELDSTSVPPAIIKGLSADGFDVSTFSPAAVSKTDVSISKRIVLIGTELPANLADPGISSEQWNDVPPASVDFDLARESLRSHVEQLIDQISASE